MGEEKKHKPVLLEMLEKTGQNIAKYGLQVFDVFGTDYSPPFAYSIGLFETYSHPEIICFGLPERLCGQIVHDVARLIKGGQRFQSGDISLEIFKETQAVFLAVDERNVGDYLLHAIAYYDDKKFPALQLVWTDRNDKFPWEDGFDDSLKYEQPLLDRNAEFKFREDKNLGIFTTRQWLEQNKPILRVVHDNEGDWQFLTGDQYPEDARIVALHQMTLKDQTLNEVFDLNYGEAAEREYIGGPWIREKFEEEDEDEDDEI